MNHIHKIIILILLSMQVFAIGYAPTGVLGTIDKEASVRLIAFRGDNILFESESTESIDGQFYNQVTVKDDGDVFDLMVIIESERTLNMTYEDVRAWETIEIDVVLEQSTLSRSDSGYSRPGSSEEISDFNNMEPEDFAEKYDLETNELVVVDRYGAPAKEMPAMHLIRSVAKANYTFPILIVIFLSILISILVYVRKRIK